MRELERQDRLFSRQLVAVVVLLALIVLVSLIEYGPITTATAEPW